MQPERGGHILRMSAFPDLIHRPDPQRFQGLVIKLPAIIVPHTAILPDHKIKVRLLLNSLVTGAELLSDSRGDGRPAARFHS